MNGLLRAAVIVVGLLQLADGWLDPPEPWGPADDARLEALASDSDKEEAR